MCGAAPSLLWQGQGPPPMRHALKGLAGQKLPGSHQEQVAHLQAKGLYAIMVVPAWATLQGAVLLICPSWYHDGLQPVCACHSQVLSLQDGG